jgi:RecB family exonuclease
MDKEVWVRGIADLLIIDDENLTARVVDYKSGNNKYPDREQLKLMALMVFAHFPHIRRVSGALLFVVKEDIAKASFMVGEAEEHWWDYRERVARIEQAHETGVWNPKPTPLCGWCPVSSCEHNRKRS